MYAVRLAVGLEVGHGLELTPGSDGPRTSTSLTLSSWLWNCSRFSDGTHDPRRRTAVPTLRLDGGEAQRVGGQSVRSVAEIKGGGGVRCAAGLPHSFDRDLGTMA